MISMYSTAVYYILQYISYKTNFQFVSFEDYKVCGKDKEGDCSGEMSVYDKRVGFNNYYHWI